MSVIHAEGFDDGVLRGLGGGNNPATVSTSAVRTGTRGIRVTTGSSSFVGYYTVTTADMATGIINFAYRAAALPGGTISLMQILDNGTVHLEIRLRADGKFDISRNGTSLGVGTFVLAANQFVHISFKFLIHDSTGTAELRLNGAATPDINLSGQDTRNAANATISMVRLGQMTSSINTTGVAFDFDDLIVQDLNGSAPENSWLGDSEVKYLFPDGVGDNADFTVGGSSPAATTWESLDEVPVDDGVTLVKSATVGHKVTTANQDLSGAGTVYAVVGLMRAKKAAAGTRGVKQSIKLSGTEVLGAEHALSTSWATYQNIWHRDPASAVWTTANVNAAKPGFEITV